MSGWFIWVRGINIKNIKVSDYKCLIIKNMKQVDVKVCGFDDLFDLKLQTVVPDYQRSYIWGKKKASELLEDFKEFFITTNDKGNYYLGSVLLYHNKVSNDKVSKFEIIDGQQRITTLLILKYLLDGKIKQNANIEFNTYQSQYFILEAKAYYEANIELINELQNKNFLNRIEFTKIITQSEDDAFTFFDTQNNRGVKLSATDFLKAYHLRAIKSESLQEKSAINWELIGYKNTKNYFLDYFFEKILWRARNWKGRGIEYENKDLILESFQKKSLKAITDTSYPLYPSANNVRFQQINRNNDGLQEFISIGTYSESPLSFPFSIRQPIHKGLNFFDYTAKYTKIYELLFEAEVTINDPIFKMRNYYRSVYSNDMSVYLRDFMKLNLIVFYDTFGKEDLEKAINHFDFVLGSLRLQKQQIKKEAVVKYIKEHSVNIIDLITTAYFTEEVFMFIEKQNDLIKPYLNQEVKLNDGVQGRYLKRLIDYFTKNRPELKERILWLNQ